MPADTSARSEISAIPVSSLTRELVKDLIKKATVFWTVALALAGLSCGMIDAVMIATEAFAVRAASQAQLGKHALSMRSACRGGASQYDAVAPSGLRLIKCLICQLIQRGDVHPVGGVFGDSRARGDPECGPIRGRE
jgi:hypothetical protein